MIDRLRARVTAAIGRKQFAQLAALVPPEDRNNPRALQTWFAWAADQDPKGAQTPAYREARTALHELIGAEALRDRALALVHDPKIQSLAGDKLDWYLAHPAAAMQALEEAGRTGALSTDLAYEGRLVAEEVRQLGIEHGVTERAAPVSPIPSDAKSLDEEWAELTNKASRTPAEEKRAMQIAGEEAVRSGLISQQDLDAEQGASDE